MFSAAVSGARIGHCSVRDTALDVTNSPWNLILACDLPYLTSQWLNWLLARAANSSPQVVIPRSAQGLEPLAAVYRRECSESILAALECGVRKVTDALAVFRTEQLPESDWKMHDRQGRVLRNMNTPSDYEEARKVLETGFSPLE